MKDYRVDERKKYMVYFDDDAFYKVRLPEKTKQIFDKIFKLYNAIQGVLAEKKFDAFFEIWENENTKK